MLTDTEEDEGEEKKKNVTKIHKHRSISKQNKLDRNPSSKISDISRKKSRSPTKKRNDSSKLTKDEIKYQHFVNDLRKDIQFYLNQCLRESHFDPCGNQRLQINPTYINKRATSIVSSCRTNKTDTIVTSDTSNRQRSKNTEVKRLTADVQTILTGPALKNFYKQFLQSRYEHSNSKLHLHPLEESIVWSNEQE